jgi:hypothetical protein
MLVLWVLGSVSVLESLTDNPVGFWWPFFIKYILQIRVSLCPVKVFLRDSRAHDWSHLLGPIPCQLVVA